MIRPAFSATKTRPSGANSTFIGWSRPVSTICSRNPEGNTAAAAGVADSITKNEAAIKAAAANADRLRRYDTVTLP
ncbi:hypothetical protein [Actinoplanes friuliensis]|uniref:hypothetical protein n=1 Tax=Actinoplanes friuliensis TaxID=196914 RepID=UPI001EE677A1|nr:hypothetical protein [Actinoplanes friuliensis]